MGANLINSEENLNNGFDSYFHVQNGEVVINDIEAESFIMDNEESEIKLYVFDYIIYNDKRYVILVDDEDIYSVEQFNDDSVVYVYRCEINNGSCSLFDLEDYEDADEIFNYYFNSEDLRKEELAEWDKKCIREVTDANKLLKSEAVPVAIVSLIAGTFFLLLGLWFVFIYVESWIFWIIITFCGTLLAVTGTISWTCSIATIKENIVIATKGILLPAYVCDSDCKMIPVFVNGMIVPYIQYKIQYAFVFDGQQYTHELKCTKKTYNKLLKMICLIIAYNKDKSKSVIVRLRCN